MSAHYSPVLIRIGSRWLDLLNQNLSNPLDILEELMRNECALLAIFSMGLLLGCGGPLDPGPQTCTLIGCLNGANYSNRFSAGSANINNLELRLCINGQCDNLPIRFTGTSSMRFDCSGSRRPACQISYMEKTTLSLDLTIAPPQGSDPLVSLQDGDRYEVSIGEPGLAPILKLDTVAKYQLSQPNGPSCAPTCKFVQLTPAI